MKISPVALQAFKNTVERILHVPGNFTEQTLEMTVVIDRGLPKETVEENVPELLRCLKRHSEVFRNVRLNVVDWRGDGQIATQVRPMSMVMLESFYAGYRQERADKHLEKLASYLKFYHARAKLIILVTDGSSKVEQEAMLAEAMRPFLEAKLMQVVFAEDGGVNIRYRFAATV